MQPEKRISQRRERLRVFFFILLPSLITGLGTFFLSGTPLGLLPGLIIGIAVGGAVAYLLSSYLLDNISHANHELKKRLQSNLLDAAAEKNKLETILKYITDGILAVGNQGHIIHANDAARVMLRMSDDDVRTKRYDDIILRFTDDLTLRHILLDLERNIGASGYSYGGAEYEIRYDKFTDTEGESAGVIIIIRDVTERRKMDNMQVDFLANVSHELKTPLTSIKGYAETLLEGAVEDREMSLEFLGIINSETDRMTRLVKELLQLSRLDTKQQKWDKQPSDITVLVRMAAKKMGMLARNKKQQLNFFGSSGSGGGSADPIVVNIDRDRIEQVIINIISNAIKYTKEGGRIDIDIIQGKGWVHISVLDNGIGIPEKELARVFERFFMVDKARSGHMGGTGLGLSISKQIIEEHGGSIRMESEYGRGTKVTISLPLQAYRGRSDIQ
jgi:two-component system sensor histidine kinase VicK